MVEHAYRKPLRRYAAQPKRDKLLFDNKGYFLERLMSESADMNSVRSFSGVERK